MSTTASAKFEKLERVSVAILKGYAANPFAKLNVRRIARDQGVSASWVYKYMGPAPQEILLSAIDTVAPLLTEIGAPLREAKTPQAWSKNFLRSLNTTLLEVQSYPELFRFYFVACLQEKSKFRERIKHHEQLYLNHRVIPQIQNAFDYSRTEAKSFGSLVLQLRMGIVFAWLTEKDHSPRRRRELLREVRTAIFERRK